MGLPTSESHILIWKELHRSNTVAYFRTDGNHLLARFAPLPSPVSGGGEPQPFGSGAQVARYVLTEEAYGVVEALWRHQATHVGFHKEPRKTQLILELLQTVGDSIRRPIDQAVLERRLVCEVGQVLGPLGAQFTTKSAGGLQQTL